MVVAASAELHGLHNHTDLFPYDSYGTKNTHFYPSVHSYPEPRNDTMFTETGNTFATPSQSVQA